MPSITFNHILIAYIVNNQLKVVPIYDFIECYENKIIAFLYPKYLNNE